MTEWQSAWALLGLVFLPFLAWWQVRRRPTLGFSSLLVVEARVTPRRAVAWLPDAFLFAAIALALVALARPQYTFRETVVKSEGIDIMLTLDTSGSMDSPDYVIGGRRTSRLDVAKAVMARFIEGRPHDRLGLVVFGEEAFTQVPLTLDHDALVNFLRQVDLGMAGKRSTAIGDAVAVASRRLASLEAPSKVVILLTDGQNNAGRLPPARAAEAAASLGIRIHTIGVGAVGGGRGLFGLQRTGDLDEATLQSLADATGGRYFRADDTETLARVYETIDQLEKSTAEVKEFVHREERFQPWLVASGCCLLAFLLLSSTVLRRLP